MTAPACPVCHDPLPKSIRDLYPPGRIPRPVCCSNLCYRAYQTGFARNRIEAEG